MASSPLAIVPIPEGKAQYWAISLFSSKTFYLNAATFLIAVLSATDVITVIPARFVSSSTALVAVLNIALRMVTVRPAVLIAPGTSKPVLVDKIDPPKPPLITT